MVLNPIPSVLYLWLSPNWKPTQAYEKLDQIPAPSRLLELTSIIDNFTANDSH